ncbi:MAG TPA: alpha/beta hydrolase [Burkholderiaceae bacterium]
MSANRILLLPGWQNSDPDHWQSRWEDLHADQRVEQDDWLWPRRGDWMAQLEEAVLADPRPTLLVAHSLGCHLVAAWAAHSQHGARVKGALLVAPPDPQREDFPPQLHNWRKASLALLPFPAIAVLSSDDPFCAHERGQAMAAAWGAEIVEAGRRGHLNSASGLGAWPEGRSLLERLAA